MVTDKVSYIGMYSFAWKVAFQTCAHSLFKKDANKLMCFPGTSNWMEDYFSNTAGVGVVVSEQVLDPVQETTTLHHQLKAVFNRDWNSQFAVDLDNLGHNPDCALSSAKR